MNKGKVLFEGREVEVGSLPRRIMVHTMMNYKCEACDQFYQFWLEKGLEDNMQDKIEPDNHKPVPFAIPCLCGGVAQHIAWGSDIRLDEYRPLKEDENYFENTIEEDCGLSHFRNCGHSVKEQSLDFPEVYSMLDAARIEAAHDLMNTESPVDTKDDPYGLAHVSTTTLKAELRRRKKSWNRRNNK